jgi:hypothetical protein
LSGFATSGWMLWREKKTFNHEKHEEK